MTIFSRVLKYFDNLSLRLKTGILVAIPLMILISCLVLFAYYESAVRVANQRVHKNLKIQIQVDEVLQLLLDSETGSRGYRLTGDNSFLDPYRKAQARLPSALSELETLVADSPSRKLFFDHLRQLVMSKLKLQKEISEFQGPGGQPPTEKFLNSKMNMDKVRLSIGQILKDESDTLARNESLTERLHRRINAALLAMLIIAGLIGVAMTILISTGIARRLDQLESNAHQMIEGEDLTDIPSGRDEIGRLAGTIEETSRILKARERELHESYLTEQKLRAAVDTQLQEAVAANKELEAFSYSVSHDLRAPLRHIAGFSQLLQKNSTNLDEKSTRYLNVIISSIRQMGALIDDLLAFSRMGRTGMRIAEVDLNPLLANVRDELAPDSEGRTIEWHVDSLPTVFGDPSMIRLVLLNLVGNAVKYTRNCDPAVIRVDDLTDGNPEFAKIMVSDNGAGFDMQFVDKLFGVFQRLHRSEEFEGIGIGLATVRRIVHRHGGEVSAQGAVNTGAKFTFTLPLHDRNFSPETNDNLMEGD